MLAVLVKDNTTPEMLFLTSANMCLQIIDIRLPCHLMLRHFPTFHLMTSECTCKLHTSAHAVQVTTQHH